MFRQIVVPKNTQLLLQLPKEFVGRQVEVIAFTVDYGKKTDDKYSWKNALMFFEANRISLKDYKFNREEANER